MAGMPDNRKRLRSKHEEVGLLVGQEFDENEMQRGVGKSWVLINFARYDLLLRHAVNA